MRTIRVGVVGCGRNSDNHLRVYSNTKEVRIIAVCDVNSTKANEKAHKYGVDHAFTDFNSMLVLDLDLVDIVTPTSTHAELSVRALESGHNVLIEKPMATSSTECLNMIHAARKNGRTLCVVHNKRVFKSIMETKVAIEREGLAISQMRISQFFASHNAPMWILTEQNKGILWEALVHPVYLTQHFLGEIQSVYAAGSKLNQSVYDSIVLVLRKDDLSGVCQFQWDVKEPLTVFQVVTKEGDRFEGDLSWDFVSRKSRRYINRRTTALRLLHDDLHEPLAKCRVFLRNLLETRSYQGGLPYENTFFTLIRQLLSFISGERCSPPVTAEEGLQSIRVLEAAEKSIKTGEVQVLERNIL